MNTSERKAKLLGRPFGTANKKLRKSILFMLIKKINKNICYKCNKKIENMSNLAIKHKDNWMSTKNPIESFYDLNNIIFSHRKCDTFESSRNTKKIRYPKKSENIKGGREKLLGEPYYITNYKLRKSIMFMLIKEASMDTCYRCNKRIENIDTLSIDHKIDWMDAENPVETFFDLDNITFSHLRCNRFASKKSVALGETGERYVYKKKNKNLIKRYRVMMKINGKFTHIGYTKTLQKAVIMRDDYLDSI